MSGPAICETAESKVDRPREELEGFNARRLEPGRQNEDAEIPLPAWRLAYWDVKAGARRWRQSRWSVGR